MRRSRQISSYVAVAMLGFGIEAAGAGGADYKFLPVTTAVAMSTAATQPIQIKLIDKAGNPVSGASISRIRLDMTPDGMATHTAKARLTPTSVPGVYKLDAEYSMTGRWQLSLAAKIPGETETVVGKIVLTVAP